MESEGQVRGRTAQASSVGAPGRSLLGMRRQSPGTAQLISRHGAVSREWLRPQARQPGYQFQLRHFLAVGPWGGHITPTCLSVPIGDAGTTISNLPHRFVGLMWGVPVPIVCQGRAVTWTRMSRGGSPLLPPRPPPPSAGPAPAPPAAAACSPAGSGPGPRAGPPGTPPAASAPCGRIPAAAAVCLRRGPSCGGGGQCGLGFLPSRVPIPPLPAARGLANTLTGTRV